MQKMLWMVLETVAGVDSDAVAAVAVVAVVLAAAAGVACE
jgi:hypothetical protein